MRKSASISSKKVMEEVLSNLFQKGETIKLAPDPPFSSSELKAYEWDINTTINYISEKLDLSQYATLLTQFKVNGSIFISIDEQLPLSGLTFTHPLHQIKFLSHAKRLRESIIRKAKDSRPNQLETWSPIHVASWLHIEQGKTKEACVCIRQHISGDMLYRIAEGTSSSSSLMADLKNNLTNEKFQDLMKNIQSLVQLHPRGKVTEVKKENNQEEVEENHQKKKTKTTAMGKRRKNKEKTQENNLETNKDKLSLVETDELTKHEDPLPPDYATIDQINSKASEKSKINQEKITQININLPSTIPSTSKPDKQPSSTQDKPTNKPSEPSKQANQPLQTTNNQATNQIHQINQQLEQELQQNRQQFLQKIQSLQQIVEQHAETIGSLRQEAHLLKTNQTNVESQISLANNKTKDLIHKLIQDRDFATKQLEQVVQLYTLTTNKEEKELTKVLQSLKDDQQRNSLVIPSIPSIPSLSSSNNNLSNPIQQQIRSLEKLNQAESIVSKPSNVSEIGVSGVDHEGDSDLDDLAPSPRPSNPANASKPNVQTTLQSNPQTTPSQTASQANLPKETLSSSVVLPTQTPLKHASMTLKQSDAKDTQQTQSITALMQETIESDILLWKQLLSEYSIKPPVDDKANTSLDPFHTSKQTPVTMIYKVSDSRQMFLQIAIKWIRLGQRMQQDITNKTKESEKYQSLLIGIQKCAISLRNGFYKQRHIFPEASSQETLPSHMRIEAIAMVYTLAMVQKIFTRVPSQDAKGKAQLSSFLNKFKYGELAVHELSRDMLKDFIINQIGMISLSWEQFDAIYSQRIDSFRQDISATSCVDCATIIDSFLHIPILSGQFASDLVPSLTLLFLTAASNAIIYHKQTLSLSEFWIQFMTSNFPNSKGNMTSRLDLFPSFANYFHRKDKQSHKSLTVEAKLIEDQLFVTDLLFSLTESFVRDLDFLWNQSENGRLFARKYFQKFSRSFCSSSSSSTSSSSVSLPNKEIDFDFILQQLKLFPDLILEHHYDLCSSIAKSLNIYDSLPQSDVLTSFSTVLLSFLRFRFDCLRTTRSSFAIIQQHKVSEASDWCKAWTLLDKWDASNQKILSSSSNQLLSHEYLLSELLGLPINLLPSLVSWSLDGKTISRNDFLLSFLQIHIEGEMSEWESLFLQMLLAQNQTTNERLTGQIPMKATALRDIQQSISKELFNDTNSTLKANFKTLSSKEKQGEMTEEDEERSENLLPTTSSSSKPLANPLLSSRLIQEIDQFNAQQRMDQISQYLDYLNDKAIKKKQLLQALLVLWDQTKALFLSDPTNATNTMFNNVSRRDFLSKRGEMTKEEIIQQTHKIQDQLLVVMQDKESIRISQLEKRMELFEKVLIKSQQTSSTSSSSLSDSEIVLLQTLNQVRSLQQSLLQANNDAMRISSRILMQFQISK